MKVSIDWLKQYVDFEESNCDLTETLPMLGLEVEETEGSSNETLDQVLVGEVISKEPHPEADRLSVCSVLYDNSQPPSTIVCGATNFKIGDHVPVALPGAKLPGGFKIKESNLRGVTSKGMMCSETELGLGPDNEGLLILPKDTQVGTLIRDMYQKDVTLDLEITANRGDCLSHIGVAREVAAYLEKELILPEVHIQAESLSNPTEKNLLKSFSVQTENCPLYTFWTIKGVKVEPSPDWLVKRLEAVGARSVNNVVDITNFVMFETGQPLHAFDCRKIDGNEIVVRQAKANEKIITLDDQERTLDEEMMVIADKVKPLVIAGVMGSVDAEVDSSTCDIILESAYFKPGCIRSTSRKLGLHTDSSQRFSRDVDPAGVNFAARRAVDLILKIAGGECIKEFISKGEVPRTSRSIEINHSFIEEKCGFSVNKEILVKSWERLGFSVKGNDPWQVTVPSFRSEVDRPIDLVEEFIRIYGTDNLDHVEMSLPALHRGNDLSYDLIDKGIENLSSQGFQEVCNYSLRSENEIKTFFPELNFDSIRLNNPLSSDHTHVRPSLIPGLLDVLSYNQKNHCNLRQVFETGRVFLPGPRGNVELISIAFAATSESMTREWKKNANLDFFEIKRVINRLLHSLGINLPKSNWAVIKASSLWQSEHASVKGDVHKNKLQISAGTFALKATKKKGLKSSILGSEILIDPILLTKKKKHSVFKPFASYPPAMKDISLVVDKSESAENVRLALELIAIEVVDGKFTVDPVSIFDLFHGKGLDDNQKSITFALRFHSSEKTLNENEVNEVFEEIVKRVENDTSYSLRA